MEITLQHNSKPNTLNLFCNYTKTSWSSLKYQLISTFNLINQRGPLYPSILDSSEKIYNSNDSAPSLSSNSLRETQLFKIYNQGQLLTNHLPLSEDLYSDIYTCVNLNNGKEYTSYNVTILSPDESTLNLKDSFNLAHLTTTLEESWVYQFLDALSNFWLILILVACLLFIVAMIFGLIYLRNSEKEFNQTDDQERGKINSRLQEDVYSEKTRLQPKIVSP